MKKLFLLSALAALLTGCNTSFQDDVCINSQPQGADVFVNDTLVGQTPTTVSLPKDGVFEVRLAKTGYKDEVVNLASVRKDSFVKFGPLVDMGYYRELTPAPVDAGMKPTFLPEYPGLNSFSDMTTNILKVDQMRKDGKISQAEHSYLIKTITEFYTKK